MVDLRYFHAAWHWLKTWAGEPGVDALSKRSQFQVVAVQQMVHVCELEQWENTPRIQVLSNEHVGGLIV